MRAVPILLVLGLAVAGCREEPEPATDPSRLPHLPSSHAEEAHETSGLPEEGVAHAQPLFPARPHKRTPSASTRSSDQHAPDRFTARLDTTKGPILIDVQRAWAPHGADRFYTLVREGVLNDVAFFRVVDGFMAQGGIPGDPSVAAQWRSRRIPDDPVVQHNTRGMVSFAMAGPNTRTTQFFINLVDNSRLDSMGFAPFGRVRDMSTVDHLYSGYGESAPRGRGPVQGRIQAQGNAYLHADFPQLDYIRRATIVGH